MSRGRTPKYVLRAQALLTLLACGPLNKSQLAIIIAAHTGKKSESIRRSFEGERDVLRALEEAWLIERTNGNKLMITPLGIRAIRYVTGYILEAAARLEEWEPSLKGLSCLDRYIGIVEYKGEKAVSEKIKEHPAMGKVLSRVLRDVHERLHEKYPEFNGDTGLEIIWSLAGKLFIYSMENVNYILADRERVRTLINSIYDAISKCRLGECSSKDEELVEMLFEAGEDLGFLLELKALKKDFIEKTTGWSGGQPPFRARLALREAGSLLDETEPGYIVSGLDYCYQELSELLASIVAVHVVNKLVLNLNEIYSDLDAVSRHYGVLAHAYANIESADLKQTLSSLVLLRDVIAKFWEYWRGVMHRPQGSRLDRYCR